MTPEQIERATTLTPLIKHKWRRKPHMDCPSGERIANKHQCIKCGLGKGTVRSAHRFHTTIYFSPDEILNRDRLPFSCQDEWIGASFEISSSKDLIGRKDFICEEEFKV